MNKTFECPNCGAPLDFTESSELTVRCAFCNNSVIVPEELRHQAPETSQPAAGAAETPAAPADPVLARLQDLATTETNVNELRHISRVERRIVRRQARDEERQSRRQARRSG